LRPGSMQAMALAYCSILKRQPVLSRTGVILPVSVMT
jgi:hypothetical protein